MQSDGVILGREMRGRELMKSTFLDPSVPSP